MRKQLWRAPHLTNALDSTSKKNLTQKESFLIPLSTESFHHHHRHYHRHHHRHHHNSLNVANELSALPPYSNMVLLEQLLPRAALSTHAGSQ
jgi:hypothetical protein